MLPKIILVSFTLSLPVLFFYLFEPHIIHEEIRSSEQMVTIKVIFSTTAGTNDATSEKCIKLHTWDKDKLHIIPAYPNNFNSPETQNLANPGEKFLFEGYPYHLVSTNLLNSKTSTKRSPRFDVVAWKPETDVKGDIQRYTKEHDPGSFSFSNFNYCKSQ